MAQGSVTFDLPGGVREVVLAGGRRYLELRTAGHTPLETVPAIVDPYPQYATNADVDAAAAAAVSALAPGTELGYAESVAPYATTNTDITDMTKTVPGLIVGPIVGKGRPVDVEFSCAGVWHSVANTLVTAAIVANGALFAPSTQVGTTSSPSTTAGHTLVVRRRVILTAGSTYNFAVVVAGAGAGTATLNAAAYAAMHLAVTQR